MSTVPKPFETIPLLEQEWQQDPATTVDKFRQFIRYHEAKNNPVATSMYRCALVQLMNGRDTKVLDGMGLNERELKEQAGA